MTTLREGDRRGHIDLHEIAYMIDQAHYVRDPTLAMVQSLENIQIAYFKSGLVDFDELESYRTTADLYAADAHINDARRTDVRPVLEQWREENGLPAEPRSHFES